MLMPHGTDLKSKVNCESLTQFRTYVLICALSFDLVCFKSFLNLFCNLNLQASKKHRRPNYGF